MGKNKMTILALNYGIVTIILVMAGLIKNIFSKGDSFGTLVSFALITSVFIALIKFFLDKARNDNMNNVLNSLKKAVDGNYDLSFLKDGELKEAVMSLFEEVKMAKQRCMKNNKDLEFVNKDFFQDMEEFKEVIDKMEIYLSEQNDTYKGVVENIGNTTGAIQEISASANVAAEGSSKTLDLTSSTVELAASGMHNVEESIYKMSEIKENTDMTVKSVEELEKLASQIGGIIESITKISDQTNLLALNAAIEAARAGEAGKGFAVVAQEIRGLADESRKAAENIDNIVGVIQRQTAQAVEKMNATSDVVIEGAEISESVGQSLSTILDSISQINNMMQDVAAGAQQQSSNTQTIAKKMDGIMISINDQLTSRDQVMDYFKIEKEIIDKLENYMQNLQDGVELDNKEIKLRR